MTCVTTPAARVCAPRTSPDRCRCPPKTAPRRKAQLSAKTGDERLLSFDAWWTQEGCRACKPGREEVAAAIAGVAAASSTQQSRSGMPAHYGIVALLHLGLERCAQSG